MVSWLKDACFYEIYPQSFKDTNNDGIGDLNGIIEKLDYIQELGCNALWLNPCFDSPFKDAGYDVRNYKLIAPRYGTNDDAKRLFDEVHKRGMHIFFDLVPGHTSEDHEWFRKSGLPKKNEYSGRYIWTDGWFNYPKDLKGIAGRYDRDGVYVVNFFATQPALNYGFLNPEQPWQQAMDSEDAKATVEALKDIMKFWLDMGVDGFRVDMADSLVKNDDEEKSGTSKIWKYLTTWMKENYPESAMVSEWNRPTSAIPAGFDMDFMLHWWGNGYDLLSRDVKTDKPSPIFKKDSKRCIDEFLDDYLYKYEKIKDSGKYCLITGNHDIQRISYYLDESERKLLFAFVFTMPGAPFIYYGDEIGMRYQAELTNKEGGYIRTGSRTPMQWDNTKNMGFSDADANELYLPVDTRKAAGEYENVAAQINDPDSLYSFMKKLIAFRKETAELLDDTNLKFIDAEFSCADIDGAGAKSRAFAYRRGSLTVLVNPDATSAIVSDKKLLEETVNKEPIFKMGDFDIVDEKDGGHKKIKLASQSFVVL